MAKKTNIKDRIISFERIPAKEIIANKRNWRTHDEKQTSLLSSVFARIGIIDAVIAYKSEREGGKLVLVDGHLRKDVLEGNKDIPVLITDLTDKEADFALTMFDPITEMAGRDDTLALMLFSQQVDSVEKDEMPDEDLMLFLKGQVADIEDKVSQNETGDGNPDKGTLLDISTVTLDPPIHQVEKGQAWKVGKSILVCAEVITEWSKWGMYLQEGSLLCTYPGMYIPLTIKGLTNALVMVQPDPYICGHILDRFSEIYEDDEVYLCKD